MSHLTPAESELESALSQLSPSNAAASRDNLLYLAGVFAGKRATRIPIRLWQSLAALLAISTAISLIPRLVPKLPIAQSTLPHTTKNVDTAPQPYTAVSLLNAVMSRGLEGLPSPTDNTPSRPTPTVGGFILQ
jgi:hypothetical protein